MASESLLQRYAKTAPEKAQRFVASLSDEQALALAYDWKSWARPEQLPPDGEWTKWLILAGRGFGKTRAAAEWVRYRVGEGCGRIGLIGPTAADCRDVMVEGESGVLSVFPPHERPNYEPSKRRITFSTGAVATLFSAEEPERLRGPQHDTLWCEEMRTWKYARDTWTNALLGLRLGKDPRVLVTTTPKPMALLREIRDGVDSVVTAGSTYDNAGNLSRVFMQEIVGRYEGTTIGQQEIYARLLDEAPGALWKREVMIEKLRRANAPPLKRVVVAIDPAVTATEDSSETGIVVAGLGEDDHGYVLADLSGRYSPGVWGAHAVGALRDHAADRIIGEVNNGGDLVEHVIRGIDPKASYKAVRASRGKYTRAEPVAALYEQGRVHHVGVFPELEDQLCGWVPGDPSPDRLDGLVWAITELMLGEYVEKVPVPSLTEGLSRPSTWKR